MEGSTEPRKLPEGTMLDDKYRIERLLATGGMGAVYLGTHTMLRKRVAIKVLNPQHANQQMIERFHREAITASQIGHEGIAQVTDIGTSRDGEPFLVMEYLEGESLASRLRASGPLAVEDACELGCAILSPLAAAHRAGIVHRDLKPDNVFLVRQSYGEMVKLLDFGISRAQGIGSEFRLTTTGLVLGTPYYMSPEQARGDSEITPAADLYAFGVMLYEMLVGQVPIQGDNYNQLMYRVMTGEFAPPRQRRPEIPVDLEQIIVHAMALEPANRPAGASELEQALLAFCRPAFREHASGRMSSPGMPLPTPLPSSARRTGGIDRDSAARDHTVLASSPTPTPPPPAPLPPGPPSGSQVAVPGREQPGAVGAPRRSRVPWIAGALVLAAGIAGTVVIATGGDAPVTPVPAATPGTAPVAHTAPGTTSAATSAAASHAASVTPQAPPDAGEAVSSAAPPGAPPDAAPGAAPGATPAATITLRFAVEPAGAVILLDGVQRKATELVVPRDDAAHTLRITAPGYAAHDETVRFDESQRLVVQLKRAPTPVRGGGRHKPGHDTDRIIDSESPYK